MKRKSSTARLSFTCRAVVRERSSCRSHAVARARAIAAMLGSMLKTSGTKQPSRDHLYAPRAPEPPPQLPRYESSSFSSAYPEEPDDCAYAQPATGYTQPRSTGGGQAYAQSARDDYALNYAYVPPANGDHAYAQPAAEHHAYAPPAAGQYAHAQPAVDHHVHAQPVESRPQPRVSRTPPPPVGRSTFRSHALFRESR